MRALDIGTWDGFWAFEMERRGARGRGARRRPRARVRLASPAPAGRAPQELDRGAGFRLAHERLGSKVERVQCNIYRATPEDLGTFDFVFCGVVLIHLRDQLLALERLAGLCRGRLVIAEEYDRPTSLLPFPVSRYHADRDKAVVFWMPSRRTWRRMIWTAGFDDVVEHERFKVQIRGATGKSRTIPQVVFHARGTAGA